MAARSFLGAGDIYIERILAGVGQGLKGPFYANKLSLKPNVDVKQSTSKGRYDYGQNLETVNLAQPSDLALEFKEVVGDVLAMALMGTSTALSSASGTMVDATFPLVTGNWVSTGHLNLNASLVVEHQVARTGTYAATVGNTGNFTSGSVTVANLTAVGVYTGTFTAATAYTLRDASGATVGSGTTGAAFSNGGISFTITAGGTAAVAGDSFTITVAPSGADSTLIEGTDYKLNRPLGLIMLLPGSTAPSGTVAKLTGAYAGATGTRIRGATVSEVRCRILFDGINQADGSECTAEVWEAILSAESEFDFLPDDFGVVSLTGTAKTPTGKTEPYVVDLKTPA